MAILRNQAANRDPPSHNVTIEGDRTPKIKKFNVSDGEVIWLIFFMVVQGISIGLDVYTVCHYITTEKYIYLAWTGSFIFASNAVRTFFSYQITCFKKQFQCPYPQCFPIIDFYFEKQRKHQEAGNNEQSASPSSTNCVWQWVSHVFLCLFQLVPLIHDCESLQSARKSRRYQRLRNLQRQRYYYMRMLDAAPNIALLKIFECFLEIAPRQLLQVNLLLWNSPRETIDLVFCSWSMMGMGWSIANYHRTIKRVQTDTNNTYLCEAIIDFIWLTLIIASRIVCICFAGTICLKCTVAACILHWAGMTIWLAMDPHGVDEFSEDITEASLLKMATWKEFSRKLLASSLGIIYIFTYVNPGKRSTNLRHVFYYTLRFVENFIVITCFWITYSEDMSKNQWIYQLLTFICFLESTITMTFTIIESVKKENAAPTDHRTYSPLPESYESLFDRDN